MPFPVTGDDANLAERLWSVYSLERTVDQATIPVSFALATVGITYAASTLAVDISAGEKLPTVIRLFLPLALVGLYTSLTKLDAASQVRGLYLDRLERELAAIHAADIGTGDTQSTDVIAPAFRQLTHPFYQRDKPRTMLALVVFHPYALSGYFVLGYAAFVLLHAAPHRGWGAVALVVYAAGMVVNFIALIRSRSLTRFKNLESRIR